MALLYIVLKRPVQKPMGEARASIRARGEVGAACMQQRDARLLYMHGWRSSALRSVGRSVGRKRDKSRRLSDYSPLLFLFLSFHSLFPSSSPRSTKSWPDLKNGVAKVSLNVTLCRIICLRRPLFTKWVRSKLLYSY